MFRLTFILLLLLPSSVLAADPASYLPLSPGKRWVLRSRSIAKPIVLEVTGASAGSFQLRFDNPWVSSELTLRPRDGKYFVNALTMNGQTAPLPADTLYWDFSAPKGKSWSNAIGTLMVVNLDKTVQAAGRTFRNCIEFRETNKQGNQLFWTFAPGVGFVQFGEGGGAFLLESVNEAAESPSSRSAPPPAPREPPTERGPSNGRSRGPWIGLAANPFANETYDGRSVQARFDQALTAGVNFVYVSPKWNEIEPRKGQYKFSDIEYQFGQAASHNFPAILHIRTIDTNQRSMPSDLMKKSFSDPEVRDRLLAVLEKVLSRAQGNVRYVLIGNEIDSYFKPHPGEAGAFATLYAQAARRIKQLVPGAQVSLSIGFDGLAITNSVLKPLLEPTDFFAITYYPLSPDFTVRDPASVGSDFARILAGAGPKKIFLQEAGYPSSEKNGSSEDKQARFYENTLGEIFGHREKFIAANFTFMSDFSDQLADGFVAYHKAAGADRFRAFMKTLGMFDDRGRPKKGWTAFQQKAGAGAR